MADKDLDNCSAMQLDTFVGLEVLEDPKPKALTGAKERGWPCFPAVQRSKRAKWRFPTTCQKRKPEKTIRFGLASGINEPLAAWIGGFGILSPFL